MTMMKTMLIVMLMLMLMLMLMTTMLTMPMRMLMLLMPILMVVVVMMVVVMMLMLMLLILLVLLMLLMLLMVMLMLMMMWMMMLLMTMLLPMLMTMLMPKLTSGPAVVPGGLRPGFAIWTWNEPRRCLARRGPRRHPPDGLRPPDLPPQRLQGNGCFLGAAALRRFSLLRHRNGIPTRCPKTAQPARRRTHALRCRRLRPAAALARAAVRGGQLGPQRVAVAALGPGVDRRRAPAR